jgi:hypothetical protein
MIHSVSPNKLRNITTPSDSLGPCILGAELPKSDSDVEAQGGLGWQVKNHIQADLTVNSRAVSLTGRGVLPGAPASSEKADTAHIRLCLLLAGARGESH